MQPLFLPGDQKAFSPSRGGFSSRLVTVGFFLLMIGVAVVGVSCLYVGEWTGVGLTVVGLGVAAYMLRSRWAEVQMLRRMRKRSGESESAPKR